MERGNLWEAYAVLVNGQLYSWKGSALWGNTIRPQAHCPMGSLGDKYFPKVDPNLRVKIVVAVFDLGEGQKDMAAAVGNWYKGWANHPDHPGSVPDYPTTDHVVLPLGQVTFDLEVTERGFWWLVGNEQHKDWEKIVSWN